MEIPGEGVDAKSCRLCLLKTSRRWEENLRVLWYDDDLAKKYNNNNSSNIYETCGQQLEVTTPSVWAVPRAPTAADDGDFDNYICDYCW